MYFSRYFSAVIALHCCFFVFLFHQTIFFVRIQTCRKNCRIQNGYFMCLNLLDSFHNLYVCSLAEREKSIQVTFYCHSNWTEHQNEMFFATIPFSNGLESIQCLNIISTHTLPNILRLQNHFPCVCVWFTFYEVNAVKVSIMHLFPRRNELLSHFANKSKFRS